MSDGPSSAEKDSDSDDNLCEEEVVDEGEREMILVPYRRVYLLSITLIATNFFSTRFAARQEEC